MSSLRWAYRLLTVAAICIFSINTAIAAKGCSARQLRARDTATIELDGARIGLREKPAFYVHDTDLNRIIFVRPDDVVALLERHAGPEGEGPEYLRVELLEVLTWIKQDLPLNEDTDLSKYKVHLLEFVSRLDFYIAELLDSGHAVIDFSPFHIPGTNNADDKNDPAILKRVDWHNRGGSGRTYCSADGYLVLSVVDEIID